MKKMLLSVIILFLLFSNSSVSYADSTDFVIENGVLIQYNGTDADVVIPDTVTSIGAEAFFDNQTIETVSIPDSVISIGDSAFSGCTNLAGVVLPDSLTTLGADAFYKCNGLTTINIPSSLQTCGYPGPFHDCENLQTVSFETGITTIPDDLFNYSDVRRIEIPDTVTIIGAGAFSTCYLEEIVIPDSVTEIQEQAFYGSFLIDVDIPDSVTTIGDGAFYYCDKLENVELPRNLQTIGKDTFSMCTALTSVEVPNSVTVIGESAFWGSGLVTLNIPDSVAKIEETAFAYCESLEKAVIPETTTSIADSAFLEDSKLVIYAMEGSYVVEYANRMDIEVVISYVGNINSELISFDLAQSDDNRYYLTGQIVVVEWVNDQSTVPKDAPSMTFQSTDGTESIDVFVTPTGTNTYYFDRFIEGLSDDKEYVFEITSGTETDVSPNRSMNVSLATSPKMVSIKNLGKIGEQKLSYYQADNGELRLYRKTAEYIGNINSELKKTELVKGPNGNYVSGEIVVVEWENDVSIVPFETPIMYFKSTDGLESLPVFVTPTGTNTYYFDRSLGDMDTSKEYVFTITSGDEQNVSPYKSMIVTTAAMTEKEGMLWESDTQYVRYRTDDNTGELRVYAVDK